MTAIADAPTELLTLTVLPVTGEPPTPCTCGGVLVWNTTRAAWEHDGDVCLPCARNGDAYCADTCPNPAVFCSQAEPLTCAHCSGEVSVEGCADCATAEPDPAGDPDHAYDLHRERNW